MDQIQSELNKLTTSIDNFKLLSKPEQLSDHILPPMESKHDHDDVKTVCKRLLELDVTHIDDVTDNFINNDTCDQLISLFEEHDFKWENGHETLSFGESYNYSGSRNPPRELPPLLNKIMSDINSSYLDENSAPLNSCLVNKYPDNESFIKEHSDDERSINRNSTICTISIGETRTVNFRNHVNGETHQHTPKSGSMYTMSKLSQELFKHKIDSEDDKNLKVRYSLTFRSLSWTNDNSTIIFGDSNTKELKFGSGGDNMFGKSMPGEKVLSYTIDQINPLQCVGYSNIVIHCGVNDVKENCVESRNDIVSIYNKFVVKVNEIRSVKKTS